jgi:ferredoxin
MKPIVDADLCTGCGLCAETCPEVFELKDDGVAHVTNEAPPETMKGQIQEAIDSCPVEAIAWAS